jgi:tetratricopeptide (TPR) repeat protein
LSGLSKVYVVNNPNDGGSLNNKGLALTNLHKYEEALLFYDKALKIEPNVKAVLFNKKLTIRRMQKQESYN